MSRLSCCSSDETDRIDTAAAYLLGLAVFFNKGEKTTKIMGMVQHIGYTKAETFEALQLLIASNLVEMKMKGCRSRKFGVVLSEYSKHIPTSRLFEDLDSVKKSTMLDEAGSFLKDNGPEIAQGAAGIVAAFVI